MNIVMPRLGLTMTEGTLAEWLKQPGDPVAAGEILFLFESEKSTMEYEAPADGVLGEILAAAGTTVACGAPVAVLETTRGDEKMRRGGEESGAIIASSSHLLIASSPHLLIASSSHRLIASSSHRLIASPAAKRRARELGVDLATLAGRGPNGRVQLADVEEARERGNEEANGRGAGERGGRGAEEYKATPVALRLAADLGIDLGRIQGSGPGGKIGREDVLAAARAAITSGPVHPSVPDRPTYSHRTPLAGVRAVIARRMSESAFSAAHVTLHTEADATALVAARQQINEEVGGAAKISYNALLVALVAKALRQHPTLNACLIDDEIRIYEGVNIALAVDTERGLLVPVIRDADRLDLIAIQRAGDELIARALAGTCLPDDFSDGTFTLTNLGAFEIDGFTPIINQPQAAILGVGRILSKPVDAGGAIALRQMMTLSLSFDHRIVDGGPAARFLQRVKQLIERPFVLVTPGATS